MSVSLLGVSLGAGVIGTWPGHERAGISDVADVVTGEAVVLEVPCARFPSRVLALAIDLAIQLTLIFILLAIVGLSAAHQGMNGAAVAAHYAPRCSPG